MLSAFLYFITVLEFYYEGDLPNDLRLDLELDLLIFTYDVLFLH